MRWPRRSGSAAPALPGQLCRAHCHSTTPFLRHPRPDRPPSRSCGSARLVPGQRQRRGGQRDADQLGGESGCAVRAGGGWPRHRDQSVAHADLHGTPLAGPRRYAFPPLPPRRRPTRACVEANQSGAAAAAAGVGLYDWHATQSLLALGPPLFLAVSIPCWCAPPRARHLCHPPHPQLLDLALTEPRALLCSAYQAPREKSRCLLGIFVACNLVSLALCAMAFFGAGACPLPPHDAPTTTGATPVAHRVALDMHDVSLRCIRSRRVCWQP